MIKLHTNLGIIGLELEPEKAPITAENFRQYVEDGFYNGTIFHRVIDGFMIQGGGFKPGMQESRTKSPIKNEADNGLKNLYGTVAMARTSDPHSASAQFFINLKDNSFLDFSAPNQQGWGYCVFAKVVEGMDIVSTIKAVGTTTQDGHENVPVDDVIIEKTEIS